MTTRKVPGHPVATHTSDHTTPEPTKSSRAPGHSIYVDQPFHTQRTEAPAFARMNADEIAALAYQKAASHMTRAQAYVGDEFSTTRFKKELAQLRQNPANAEVVYQHLLDRRGELDKLHTAALVWKKASESTGGISGFISAWTSAGNSAKDHEGARQACTALLTDIENARGQMQNQLDAVNEVRTQFAKNKAKEREEFKGRMQKEQEEFQNKVVGTLKEVRKLEQELIAKVAKRVPKKNIDD